MLCGCLIPFDKGLLGHSDADAPVHALIDALLGALALGDIGGHFPDRDPAYRNADSMELLRLVSAMVLLLPTVMLSGMLFPVESMPTVLQWVSAVIPPRYYISAMRKRLADGLHTAVDNVSVKAKTAEKLGPVGAGESLEAHAVVLLVRKHGPAGQPLN